MTPVIDDLAKQIIHDLGVIQSRDKALVTQALLTAWKRGCMATLEDSSRKVGAKG